MGGFQILTAIDLQQLDDICEAFEVKLKDLNGGLACMGIECTGLFIDKLIKMSEVYTENCWRA